MIFANDFYLQKVHVAPFLSETLVLEGWGVYTLRFTRLQVADYQGRID